LETLAAEPLRTVQSDADGRFLFDGISAGAYVLRVIAAGHPEAVHNINVPAAAIGDYDVQLS
jgi:hypothetical protein